MKRKRRQVEDRSPNAGKQPEISAKLGHKKEDRSGSWLERSISYWRHTKATKANATLTFREWIKRIQTKELPEHRKIRELLVKELAEIDPAKRKQLESQRKRIKETQLPAITPAGTFSGRRIKGQVGESSGISVIDIDLKDNPELEPAKIKQQVLEAKRKLNDAPWSIGLVIESPSAGAKLFVEGTYDAACAHARELLPGIVIDESDEDNRLCFDPFDPKPLVFEDIVPAKAPKKPTPPEPFHPPPPQPPSLMLEHDLARARKLAEQQLNEVGEFQQDEKGNWFAKCECPRGHPDAHLYFNNKGIPYLFCASQDNRLCRKQNQRINEWFEAEWTKAVAIISDLDFESLMAFDAANDPGNLIGRRWIVKGSTALWAGTSGAGKSTLQMQAAIYFGLGFKMFGMKPVRPLKSLIIQAEDDPGDVAEQLQGVLTGIETTEREIDPAQLQAVVRQNVIIKRVYGVTGITFCRLLRKLIAEHTPDLVWINPLFAYAGCSLMDAEKTGHFLRDLLFPVAWETGVVLNVIHHAGKTDRDSKAKEHWTDLDWQYLGFGSSEIQNSFRVVNILTPIKRQAAGKPCYQLILSKRGERARATTPDIFAEPTTRLFLVRATNDTLFWLQVDEPQKGKTKTTAHCRRKSTVESPGRKTAAT
jgi:hypothetical protein